MAISIYARLGPACHTLFYRIQKIIVIIIYARIYKSCRLVSKTIKSLRVVHDPVVIVAHVGVDNHVVSCLGLLVGDQPDLDVASDDEAGARITPRKILVPLKFTTYFSTGGFY